ncbi:MAG: N-acetylmuramoyl-L-alanine amidase [Bdellovibrionales bacterium]|nr:N-acetylmuramoyl-L-alanine amidase [Bdellovibrionales bacterium]
MKYKTPFDSPNTDNSPIDVQFLILHYTGCSLEKTFEIFKDPKKKVSAHFVIDQTGAIYEIISCIKKPVKAFHAGQSSWKTWTNFNNHSIGVELVNFNGNLFNYTEEQYSSLAQLILHLQKIYPPLQSPERILGHEHIAGFRGKVDPGTQFNWDKLFKQIYPSHTPPERKPVLPLYLKERFKDLTEQLDEREKKWDTLNTLLEKQYLYHLQTEGS